MLAIGIGATLGSPLFIPVPHNIYSTSSSPSARWSLRRCSLCYAKAYADMYTEMRQKGLEAGGGPLFTRVAVG